MKKLLLVFICFLFQVGLKAQTTYVWNGATTDWGTNTNWLPNGVPGILGTDQVSINSTAIIPILDVNRIIGGLTITGKTLNLGGFILSVAGTISINSGVVNNGTLFSTNSGNFGVNNSVINSDIYMNSTGLFNLNNSSTTGITDFSFGGFNGCCAFSNNTISGAYLNLTKTAPGNTGWPGGGNTINCPTSIVGYSSNLNWQGCSAPLDKFNDLTLINAGTDPSMTFVVCGSNQLLIRGNLQIKDIATYSSSYNSDHMGIFRFGNYTVTGNVVFTITPTINNNNGNRCICLGYNTNNASMILAVAGNLTMSQQGCFVSGTGTNGGQSVLQIVALNQTTSGVANVLTCTSNSVLNPNISISQSTLTGSVFLSSDRVDFGSNSFKGSATITKNGSGTEYVSGNNTFLGISTFNSNGSGQLNLGYQPNGQDYYLTDAYFYSNPGGLQINGNNGGGICYGDVYFGCTTSGCNISFTQFNQALYTTILGSLKIAPTGFNNGSLTISNIRQTNSAKIQILTTSGAATLYLGGNHNNSSNLWAGPVSIVGPSIELRGNTFTGTAYLEKNGNIGGGSSQGGNVFNSSITLVNSSPISASWNIGGGNGGGTLGGDTYNGALTLINKGVTTDIALRSGTNQSLIFNNTVTIMNLDNAGTTGRIGINSDNGGNNSNGTANFTDNFYVINTRQTNGSYIYFGTSYAPNISNLTGAATIYLQTFSGGSLRFYNFNKASSTDLNLIYTNTSAANINITGSYSTFTGNTFIRPTVTTASSIITFNNSNFLNDFTITGYGGIVATSNNISGSSLISVSGSNSITISTCSFNGDANFSSNYINASISSVGITLNSNTFNSGTIVNANGSGSQKTIGTLNIFNGTTTLTGSVVGDLNANTFAGTTLLLNQAGGTTQNILGNTFMSDA